MTEIKIEKQFKVSVTSQQIESYLIASGWKKEVNQYRSPNGEKIAIELPINEQSAINTIAGFEQVTTGKAWEGIVDLGRNESVDLVEKYRPVRGEK